MLAIAAIEETLEELLDEKEKLFDDTEMLLLDSEEALDEEDILTQPARPAQGRLVELTELADISLELLLEEAAMDCEE